MNSLVDYGTSSDESESENETTNITESKCEEPAGIKLPKPNFGSASSATTNSVFSNPFVEAEIAKTAILEKHVKMVPTKDQVQTINGKKICWNYRKGRCRFGHNCIYAHDSDLQKTPEELELEKQDLKTIVCEGSFSQPQSVLQDSIHDNHKEQQPPEDNWNDNSSNKTKLKRPGLSQDIVPSKKALKFYKRVKGSE